MKGKPKPGVENTFLAISVIVAVVILLFVILSEFTSTTIPANTYFIFIGIGFLSQAFYMFMKIK